VSSEASTEAKKVPECRKVSTRDAVKMLEQSVGKRFVELFRHGSLVTELYAPRGKDTQTPHTRDEVYVVLKGSGEFVGGDKRERFEPGDFLFVPAGVEHRFENFTDDFAVWVMFYGPEGGERSTAAR
jgi:mannose-6-phosphate isomerase-like protein (cupin superfamily)